MNRQETFDTVLFNLRIQGKPALNGRGHCVLRGLDNTKCAIGWLIPDEQYRPSLEDLVAVTPMPLADILGWRCNLGDIRLLDQLRTAHDVYLRDSLASFEARMASIAKEFNLNYTYALRDP